LIDFTSRVLRKETALDFMNDYPNDEIASENMIGLSVMANYGNNRNYRIDGIDLSKTPLSKFDLG
jgi:aubergine-like protein